MIERKEIEVNKLKPNPWNPNQMTEEQEEYLEKEMKRIGFAQEILVRQKEDYYEIIDGEHRLKTAKKIGLKKVNCAIIELNDEEAKLTTINMNKIKGVDNPIKLAELLEDLKSRDENLLDLLAMEREEVESLIEIMNEREIEDLSELEGENKPKTVTCPKCGEVIEI